MNNYNKNQVPTDNKFLRDIQDDLAKSNSRIKKYLEQNLIEGLSQLYDVDSEQEKQEIRIIKRMQRDATDAMRDFAVNVHDFFNVYNLYEKICKITNCNVNAKNIEYLCANYSGLLHYLKVKFNRPRPYDACKNYDIKIDLLVDKRYRNGSFPSGHAFEAFLIAHHLSDIDESNKDIYMLCAKKISESRIIAGVHFPSDIKGGIFLAQQIYKTKI